MRGSRVRLAAGYPSSESWKGNAAGLRCTGVKNIGFLSFGHWTPSPHSHTRSAADALLQSIDLAVAAEELGADGAYFRVHHFARQLASPFPLPAAIGARTSRIEIGTGVIDMRYENPMYLAEDAGAADLGMNLMSSTLLTEDTGVPFHQLQAEQIRRFRQAWQTAGHQRDPRVSVSRSIFPIVSDLDRRYFGLESASHDQVGRLDGRQARFGKTYAGEPDRLIADLAKDEAIAAADTVLLTVPNQLGVEYNAHVIEALLTHVAPGLGWR